MSTQRGQTSLEYLLILAGSILLVVIIATVVSGAMAPGMDNLKKNNSEVPEVWSTPTEETGWVPPLPATLIFSSDYRTTA